MTRHELKEQVQHDAFAESVAKVVDYTSSHRTSVVKWVVIAAVVALIAGGIFWYSSYTRSQHQQELEAAFEILGAPIGSAAGPGVKSYPTEEAKRQASIKALNDVVAKAGSSHEGLIARYYLGTIKSQKDPKGAEADLKAVADSGSDVSALAKVALSSLYAGENRVSEAQALLRGLVDKPNGLVSKAQAQILLAQLDQTADPQEAKRILQQLKKPDQDPAVTRAVEQLSAQLEH